MTAVTRAAGALALGGLVVVLDTTVAVLAVPVLVREFDAPLSTVQWLTTGYLLALVATMPLAAWLGARFGERRVWCTALLLFVAGSVWAGVASGIGELVAARVVQGLGGGLVNPLGMAMGLRGVPREHRGRIAAVLGLPVLVGPLLGPVLAGWLVDAVSWRAVFVVPAIPALAAVLLVRRVVAADDRTHRPAPFDALGSVLLVTGSVTVVLGIAEATAPAPLRGGCAAAGAVLLGAFVRRSWWADRPLLRVRLLADPSLGRAAVVLGLFAAAYFGSMLLLPNYVQITRGDTASVAGWLAVPGGLATGLALQVATRLVDRVPAGRVVVGGAALAGLGTLAGVVVLRTDTPYWVLVVLACVLGAGSGGVLMPVIAVGTRELTGTALASGTTLLSLLSQLSTAIGTAAVTGVYGLLVSARVPGGLAGASRLDDAARDAVAPQLVTAQRLTQCCVLAVLLLALAAAARLPLRRPVPCLSGSRR